MILTGHRQCTYGTCMGEIKPYTHTLDARKNFHQLFTFISRQCLLNALNTWENKKILSKPIQYCILFEKCVAKPESVRNIRFELISDPVR